MGTSKANINNISLGFQVFEKQVFIMKMQKLVIEINKTQQPGQADLLITNL